MTWSQENCLINNRRDYLRVMGMGILWASMLCAYFLFCEAGNRRFLHLEILFGKRDVVLF